MRRIGLMMFCLLLGLSVLMAQEEKPSLKAEVGLGFGKYLAEGEQLSEGALFPGMALDLFQSGFSFAVDGIFAYEYRSVYSASDEIDFTLSYEYEILLGEKVSSLILGGAFSYYLYLATANEPDGDIIFCLGWDPVGLEVAYGVFPSNPRALFTLIFGHEFELSSDFIIVPEVTGSATLRDKTFSFTEVTASLGGEYAWNNWAFGFGVNYMVSGVDGQSHFYPSMSVGYEF